MSDYSDLPLELELRNQIYRDTIIPKLIAKAQRFSPYDKLRKYFQNKLRAWKSQQRKLAKAQQQGAPARRRRQCRGIKPRAEEQNSPMKAHGIRRSPQTLRREREALRRWKIRYANQPPPSPRDEATESQLPEAPARRRRLCRGTKPRAEEQKFANADAQPLGPSRMLRREHKEAIRRWKLQQVHQPALSQKDESVDLQQ
ncbi:uncharacterized protein EAF02_003924 [Botrytis sinoallii]|uniref:uncharacterized protein n=1 Tax=Botrytis sinoallii TaxID=1463999 RepID=UPI00190252A5|nr:uncharacterized protein EAF02_003924 [Botrytis sinoallii]KAF7885415.1 hypothetical protein EAF02_003924 [Botrytis sinoallii]